MFQVSVENIIRYQQLILTDDNNQRKSILKTTNINNFRNIYPSRKSNGNR